MSYFHLSNSILIQSSTIVQVYGVDVGVMQFNAVVSYWIWLIIRGIMYIEKILGDLVEHTCSFTWNSTWLQYSGLKGVANLQQGCEFYRKQVGILKAAFSSVWQFIGYHNVLANVCLVLAFDTQSNNVFLRYGKWN